MVEVLFGKVCSGKSTYAKSKKGVLVLEVDEMINELGQDCEGPSRHKAIEEAIIRQYLKLIVNLDGLGIDVILDHGLWYKKERDLIRKTLEDNGIDYRFLYFYIPYEERLKRLESRNIKSVRPIEPNKLAYFDAMFEEPDEKEICTIVV